MKKITLLFAAIVALLSSCKKDEEIKKTLEIPNTYDGSNFEANTSVQNALINQLTALTDEAKKGRTATNTVSKENLDNLFELGTNPLSNEITSYYKNRLTGDGNWFDKLAKASGKTWDPNSNDSNLTGGVYGGYLFDAQGVEIEQLIEKGQFNATLYNHASTLMSGPISLATVDQLVAIFGAKPAFANSGSTNVVTENRDRAMANYAARRDKNNGEGMYSQIKAAFIKLQAAVRAGSGFDAEKGEALVSIRVLWEKINAATVVNYCYSSISALSNTNPTEAQIGGALHAIGECIGFMHGYRTINQNFKSITDAQIDEILTLLNAPAQGTASVYKFATDPANELPKIQQVLNKLQSIYGFSNQEMEDFKSNWVSIQQR